MSDGPGQARWWSIRRAQSLKPASYTCPLCGELLHAMTEHVLIAPDGDLEQRRHAHTECVRKARAEGRLPLRDEWERAQPREPGRLRRLFRRDASG